MALDLCARDDVPEIAKLVAPSIAGQSWTETEDLDPLLAALSGPRRPHALAVLRHLVASLTAPPNSPIAGAEAAPWSRLAVILAAELAEDLVFPVRLLVTLLADARSELTNTQADELGEAARQLLSWLWDNDSSDMVAARFAIRAVCASFESDPLAAETLLRRGLCREHVRSRGYEELRHYADHVEDLAGAPGLVVALYTAAFAFDDAGGTGLGVMLGGPVLSLQSDRRQEFRMARYGLASVFGRLMQRAPEVATAALLRVLRASDHMRRDGYTPGPYATFTTEGVDCRVRDEWSAYQAAWLMSHDDEATLIAAWTSGLATLAVGGDPTLGSSLVVFLANNRTFAGWRILVDAATRDERLIPTIVRVIASAFPVLSAATLREPLCRLAAAARLQANLMTEFRAGIETPIVALEARVALTACLDGTTSPASADEDEDGDVARVTQAYAGATPVSSRQILQDWLNAEHDEQGPIPLAVQTNFATVAGSLGAHDSANEEDWYLASRVADRMSRIDQDCHTEAGQLVAIVLLRVLASAATYDGAWDGDEEVESIPSHACVLGAAQGIVRLYAAGLCDDLLPATTIRTIVDHPLPWARMALARSSGRLFARDPELAWSTLDRLAGDPVARVAADAVWMATRFRRRDPERAKALLTHAVEEHGTRSKLVGAAVMSLGGALFMDGVEEPERFISILEDAERIFDAASLLHGMRPSITPPADDPGNVDAHHAALQILRAVSSVAVRRYDEAAPRWEEAGDEDARERARDAIQALDAVVSETYFASGAFRGGDDKKRPTAEQMAILFDETAGDLLELLRHLPARSIHHVVEIAAANANVRPTEAFLLIGDAVRAARAVGYETDSLAKDLVLGIVRAYMADRSELFQGSTESASAMQAALVTILDSFVAVGWPEARSMAYHLHEVLQ